MNHTCTFFILVATLFSLGCLHGGETDASNATLRIEVIYRSASCPTDNKQAHALWIDSPAELQRQWKNLHGHMLGGASSSTPEMDVGLEGFILVHMGQQRTGGYAIDLADPVVRVKDGFASISVDWVSPAMGDVVTQALTAPCILLKLKTGDFHAIQIIDQNGRVRATADVLMGTK